MENILDFISNNYVWFIIAGSLLLIIALILILVKKNPVTEENIETKKEDNDIIITEEEPIIEEVKEPIIEEIEEPKDDITIESIVDATPIDEPTETLDIIDEVKAFENQVSESVGEAKAQEEKINIDEVTTTEEDIWKF